MHRSSRRDRNSPNTRLRKLGSAGPRGCICERGPHRAAAAHIGALRTRATECPLVAPRADAARWRHCSDRRNHIGHSGSHAGRADGASRTASAGDPLRRHLRISSRGRDRRCAAPVSDLAAGPAIRGGRSRGRRLARRPAGRSSASLVAGTWRVRDWRRMVRQSSEFYGRDRLDHGRRGGSNNRRSYYLWQHRRLTFRRQLRSRRSVRWSDRVRTVQPASRAPFSG